MTASRKRTVDWDAFWAKYPDALTEPIDITLHQAREVSEIAGGVAADAAELREWLEMLGFLPSEAAPGPYRAEHGAPFNAYRRPGQ